MRQCSKCRVLKDISEFNYKYKSRGIRSVQCRACARQYVRVHYNNNKQYYLDKAHKRNEVVRREARKYLNNYLLEHSCVDCGESDIIVLEFDHVREKDIEIAKLSRYGSISRIKGEVAKCEVRCANCHRRKTYYQQHYTNKHL